MVVLVCGFSCCVMTVAVCLCWICGFLWWLDVFVGVFCLGLLEDLFVDAYFAVLVVSWLLLSCFVDCFCGCLFYVVLVCAWG